VPGGPSEASRAPHSYPCVPIRGLRATWKSRHQLLRLFPQVPGPVDRGGLSNHTQWVHAIAIDMTAENPNQTPTCPREHNRSQFEGARVARHPKTPTLPLRVPMHQPSSRIGSILYGNYPWTEPFRHIISVDQIKLHFLRRPFPTAAIQPASYSSSCVGWQHRPPKRRGTLFSSTNRVLGLLAPLPTTAKPLTSSCF